MQAKDVPEIPILVWLRAFEAKAYPGDREFPWATWFHGYSNSVDQSMPAGTPEKVVRAKMAGLIRRGLVAGCGCGCRGDYELTDAGIAYLDAHQSEGAKA